MNDNKQEKMLFILYPYLSLSIFDFPSLSPFFSSSLSYLFFYYLIFHTVYLYQHFFLSLSSSISFPYPTQSLLSLYLSFHTHSLLLKFIFGLRGTNIQFIKNNNLKQYFTPLKYNLNVLTSLSSPLFFSF